MAAVIASTGFLLQRPTIPTLIMFPVVGVRASAAGPQGRMRGRVPVR